MHLLVNTGGGDAPGLNAVIRAVTLSALRRGWWVTGIRKGYHGLLSEDPAGLIPLDRHNTRDIAFLGGTMLGTVNKGNPFEYPVVNAGKTVLADISERVVQRFRAIGADGLIAIGGDGSLRIAGRFAELGIPVIGVPKTIDNDVAHTQATFGFDTACAVATDAIDRLRSTAESHERVMVVEVMGRYAGWIALHAGISGGANGILIPEVPFDIQKVAAAIRHRFDTERRFAIVVVAEGARPIDGEQRVAVKEVGREVRLGGMGEQVASQLSTCGFETRSLVLGHLQRGGGPTSRDRLLALRFGAAAVRLAEEGRFGHMVGYQAPHMVPVPLSLVVGQTKTVPLDGDAILTARDLGITLGD